MSIKHLGNKKHAYKRSKQRFGLNRQLTTRMINNAYRYGTPVRCLPEGPLKDYLLPKQNRTKRRLKIYNNKVFVFASTSTSCITVYPISENLLKKQKSLEHSGKLEKVSIDFL